MSKPIQLDGAAESGSPALICSAFHKISAAVLWRLKIGWECVGGNYAMDSAGRIARPAIYRYVWMHRRTHEIRIHSVPNAQGDGSPDTNTQPTR